MVVIWPLVLALVARMWASCSLDIILMMKSRVEGVMRRDWVRGGLANEETRVVCVNVD